MVRYNITVNCVSPGPTGTPAVLKFMETNPKMMEPLKSAIPMKRLARPEEIAAAVLFFASDAAGYITGQVLSVSGGLTMC